MIPFNRPYQVGNELTYIQQAIESRHISGDGQYSKKCQAMLEKILAAKKTLLTTSCTDALEMIALLLNLQPGDEFIVSGFTFVSTVNAFVLRGAIPIFCDSRGDHPNMDVAQVETLISPKTKAILVVHYAGISVDLDPLIEICQRHNLALIEDAAQAIGTTYKGRSLGTIGKFGALSFHETKNIICGEGGALLINDSEFISRAEIIREKGTNRSAFFRGEVDKYNWVDIGSSFLPSDINAAFLYAQLESFDAIQSRRLELWNRYQSGLADLVKSEVQVPMVPNYSSNNAHIYFIVTRSLNERTKLLSFLRDVGVHATFHYQPLHKSKFWTSRYSSLDLPQVERYSDQLLRLPLFHELLESDVDHVTNSIRQFYSQ